MQGEITPLLEGSVQQLKSKDKARISVSHKPTGFSRKFLLCVGAVQLIGFHLTGRSEKEEVSAAFFSQFKMSLFTIADKTSQL